MSTNRIQKATESGRALWRKFEAADASSELAPIEPAGQASSLRCDALVRPFEIGDLVEPTPESRFVLRSGGGSYSDAVCVSVSPLVLVSWDADMRWSATVKPEYFRSKGRVAASVMRRCNKRLLA